MIPDPIERAEASAECAYDELSQPGGKFKCYECDAIFDPEREGGTISPDPYAMPVCEKCYTKAYQSHVDSVKSENSLFRKKAAALEKYNGTLTEALENLVGTLRAHDAISYDCDRSGETYCDCLDKALKQAELVIEKSKPSQAGLE